jgi:hypothetical protein
MCLTRRLRVACVLGTAAGRQDRIKGGTLKRQQLQFGPSHASSMGHKLCSSRLYSITWNLIPPPPAFCNVCCVLRSTQYQTLQCSTCLFASCSCAVHLARVVMCCCMLSRGDGGAKHTRMFAKRDLISIRWPAVAARHTSHWQLAHKRVGSHDVHGMSGTVHGSLACRQPAWSLPDCSSRWTSAAAFL